jgi:hypothetical protein
MTADEASRVVSEQIRWWLFRGYTAQFASSALGIEKRAHGGWLAVRRHMERWMMERGR